MDHLAAGVAFETTVDTQGSIHASGSDLSKTPEFNSFVNSGIAYINGTLLFSSEQNFATFRSQITAVADSSASSLVPSQYSEVVEGYKAIYSATVDKLYPTVGLVEVLLSINVPGMISVQAALQQPMSQGRLYINSSSIWDNPIIDPQYFSHPADVVVLRQGIKLARLIGSTSPLKDSLGAEVRPGPDVQTDDDIESWLRNNTHTEFHPSGACAMLPKAQGGVVDANLKVYGLSNVRVVDSSIFPISFSAHLMAPTYALAEKAASIILAGPTPSGTGTSTAAPGSTSKASGALGFASTSWLRLFLPLLVGLFL
jgi:choline dehydrogenase-like flavoprotein